MHFNELSKCLAARSHSDMDAANCTALRDEISTLDAFHELLLDFTGPEALVLPEGETQNMATSAVSLSMLLVALHNTVTDSIDPVWNFKRRQLFCAASVLADLQHSMVGDVASRQLQSMPVTGVAAGALGVQAHPHLNCSLG